MLYFILTTSLIEENYEKRKNEYLLAIETFFKILKKYEISNYEKVIIVENNGERNTFLDNFKNEKCDILYTNNNNSYFPYNNKGSKELFDVIECIEKYNINDTDFIVKMTGRYELHLDCPFMNEIKNLDVHNTDCIIKYGFFKNPVDYKCDDCCTGLIGMKVKYIKKIVVPLSYNQCIEWSYAKAANEIEENKIIILKNNLGIKNSYGYFI